MVSPSITKQDTNFRKAIPAAERLAVTLRFLASGESQESLSFSFRIGRSTLSSILSETCDAIFKCLSPMYLRPPQSENEWKKISSDFKEAWNLPHVVGAIDGKHIRIQCPKISGTLFHNYKGFFSFVLLAVCDANYCFSLFDLGAYGSNNDSGALLNSPLGEKLETNELHIPQPETLEGCSFDPLPYFLARLRIFHTPIIASIQNAEKYVLACLALHNYFRLTDNALYTFAGFIDTENDDGEIQPGDWRKVNGENQQSYSLLLLPNVRGSRYKTDAINMRESIKEYVNSETGSVNWQWEYVRRT